MSTVALIVAAGRGARFGGDVPKQYARLADRTVLRHSVETFLFHPMVDTVRVVIADGDQALYADAMHGLDLLEPVTGGDSRQQSVLNGLRSLVQTGAEVVLVHDAARPFVTEAAITDAIAGLDGADGAISATQVVDTLKRERDGHVGETVDRHGLWRAQTPQVFRFDALLAAHEAVPADQLAGYTDDATVAEAAGLRIVFAEGDDRNFKITTTEDLQRAEQFMTVLNGATSAFSFRTGSGFDVHAFGGAGPVVLCGVEIPSDKGLSGHSDADVALHALTDALLGAIGDGDIGAHFPPNDPQWKGAPSDRFVSFAAGRISDLGGRIANVDVTIICETPKIGPHRDAMRQSVAGMLDLDVARVSIKATTTEKLGFTGRGEGIAASAVATVKLPDDA